MDSPKNAPRVSGKSFRSVVIRYGCAVGSIALATSVRLLLDPVLGNKSPSSVLLFAVLVTASFGGVWPALLAVFLGSLSVDYFVMEPRGSLGLRGADEYVSMAIYWLVGTGIALLGGAMRAARLASLQARKELEQSEEQLRLTLYSSGIAVWNWKIASNVISADENCSIMFGVPTGEFPQTIEGFAAFVHLDDRERVQRDIRMSVEHIKEYGQPDRLTGVAWDVTERQEAEERLRAATKMLAAEGTFRELLEAAPDSMVVVNREGKIVPSIRKRKNNSDT